MNQKRNVVRLKALQRESRKLDVVPHDTLEDTYFVSSASQPGAYYRVRIDPQALSGQCSCPWAQHGGINCKHVLAVLRAHYAGQGRLSFWPSRQDARRQHRRIIAGADLFATVRRAA